MMVRSIVIGCVALVGCATGGMAAEQRGVDLTKLAGWDIVVAADAIPSEAYIDHRCWPPGCASTRSAATRSMAARQASR
jgi:hypothetical protein